MDDWHFSFPDAVGFMGVVILIGAYAALQLGRLASDRPWYSALNGLAALLIGYSLLFSFNAASMVIEIFWFAISLFGFIKAIRKTTP